MRHANIETTKLYDMSGEEVKKAAVDILPFKIYHAENDGKKMI